MGDVIECSEGTPTLRVRAVGTSALERVLVRNGVGEVATWRPSGARADGQRLKIIWRGAERRGRARMVAWDGSLHVQGNAIVAAQPINFWNPDRPLAQPQPDLLTWRSISSGGVCGAIVTLADPDAGHLHLQTLQGELHRALGEIGADPVAVDLGGVGKRIEVSRLPGPEGPRDVILEIPLAKLQTGDNPVHVRVDQEDGHMAWSSPIYVAVPQP